MSTEVQFTEEVSTAAPRPREVKGLYKMVISLGLAKDEKEASAVLISIAIIAIIIAVAYPFVIGVL